MALFTVDEAVAQLRDLLPVLDEVVALRAEAAELAAATTGGRETALGGLPELKAANARLDELLVDFPAELDGVDVLLCWLEGDRELRWYHRTDLGFAGRRRLP